MITSGQLRAGRALIRWDQKDLAEGSKVSLSTIKRIEGKDGPIDANQTTINALQRALEAAGVEFTNGGQPGVRLRSTTPSFKEFLLRCKKSDTPEGDFIEDSVSLIAIGKMPDVTTWEELESFLFERRADQQIRLIGKSVWDRYVKSISSE